MSDSPKIETTIMSVWPSIAAMGLGRALGRLYSIGPRVNLGGVPLRPGWLAALATLPLVVPLYFLKIIPRLPLVLVGVSNPWCKRYRLTTLRVLIEHPFDAMSDKRRQHSVKASVALDAFDSIERESQPGYQWYRASDLVFRQDGQEVLRLAAVPHAESFRQTCIKARAAHLGVTASRAATSSGEPVA